MPDPAHTSRADFKFSTAFLISFSCAVLPALLAEARLFKELVHFIYHQCVSPAVSGSLEDLSILLLLSDRFDLSSLTTYCTQELVKMSASLTPSQGLHIVSLPAVMHSNSELQEVLAAARAVVRQAYAKVFEESAVAEERVKICQLPQAAIEVLLESNTLMVNSEDSLLKAALAWVDAKDASPSDKLQLLTMVVLPRLRSAFLSPKAVLDLTEMVINLLKSKGSRRVCYSTLEADIASLKVWGPTIKAITATQLPAGSAIAVYHVNRLLEHLRAAEVPMLPSMLDYIRPGAPQFLPRKGYRPSDATMKFYMTHERCQKLVPRNSRNVKISGDRHVWESGALAFGR